jgi:hypothetical protein
MNKKDVIYIDVDDDITSIIGKVKDAKEKIIALVPPKRIGALQSAVNLRLLTRAASGSGKRIVLITGNSALSHLAASADIPVAKDLKTPPKLTKQEMLVDDGEDVIDGNDIAVGEHAGIEEPEPAADDDTEEIILPENLDDIDVEKSDADDEDDKDTKPAKKDEKSPRGRIKVPDFGDFRKKALIGGVLVVLLGVFLWWANFIAPHATVVVSAKTVDKAVSVPVTVGADVQSDSSAGKLQAVVKKDKSTQTVDFVATGKKNLGEKATGKIKIYNTNSTSVTIASGTQVQSAEGLNFVTSGAVTVPAATVDFIPPYLHKSSANVDVVAAEGGEKYNGASGSVSGVPSNTEASFVGTASGGTDKMATVVSQADIDGAKAQLKDQGNDEVKASLKKMFGNDVVVLDASFVATGGDPKSDPAVDQETPSGKAKLTSEVTYQLMAISKSELNRYLDALGKTAISGTTGQRVYDNGLSNVRFSDYKYDEKSSTATVTLAATAQVGPQIDDDEIKDQAKGRRTGEVIDVLNKIDGVSDVTVKTSPFWVGGVPNDVNKITVEFKLLK